MSTEKQKYDFILDLDNPSNVHHIERAMVPPNAYVLDVGCHTGILGAVLKKDKSATVIGIDVDTSALQIARTRINEALLLNVEETGWEQVLISQGWKQFDIVLFGDVLEHTREPESILIAARKLLKPGGRIVVSIPNVAHWRIRLGLLFGKFQYADSGILDKTHLRFYTSKSGRELLKRCGYTITASDVAGYDLPHWLIRALPGLLAIQLVFAATPTGE